MMVGPRKRERTRSAILETALSLFAEHGYETTTMADIAAVAGVVRQTVLNHFPRKDDFVLAWGTRRREALNAVTPVVHNHETAWSTIRQLYDTLAHLNEQERALAQALHPYYETIACGRQVPDAIINAIERGRAEGEFDRLVSADIAGEVLTAVYFDALGRWLRSAEPGPFEPILLPRIDLVVRGLAAGH